jgi:hypothetical protein
LRRTTGSAVERDRSAGTRDRRRRREERERRGGIGNAHVGVPAGAETVSDSVPPVSATVELLTRRSDTMSPMSLHLRSVALALMTVIGVAFVWVTPPFQAPDEVGHFGRAYAFAEGVFRPAMREGKPVALVPAGIRDYVAATWQFTAGRPEVRFDRRKLRDAWGVELQKEQRVEVVLLAQYTIVPYLPQTLACGLGHLLNLRPATIFYLGRVLNLFAFVTIVAFALRRAGERAWSFAACAMLPMALYIVASFSPDAMTLALSLLATAMALDDDVDARPLGAVTFLLALCKPVYFLLPLVALVRRRRLAAMLVPAMVAGIAISAATASASYYPMRGDVVTDPAQQVSAIARAPWSFVALVLHDWRIHAWEYTEQMIGRLGWLDVPLPGAIVEVTLVALIVLAVLNPVPLRSTRITALALIFVTIAAISLSQFLAWSPVGGDTIEGIQGRYYLPLLPLLGSALGLGIARRAHLPVRVVCLLVVLIASVSGIIAIVTRYY